MLNDDPALAAQTPPASSKPGPGLTAVGILFGIGRLLGVVVGG
jgi:hypothetical protein